MIPAPRQRHYEWDGQKAAESASRHGVVFEDVARLDWTAALTGEDDRYDYGERRFRSLAPIDGRLHVLIFTMRGDAIRVISLRKANDREVRDYERQWPPEAAPRL